MKKMLLLLVSGLLIVCMAGSAIAGSEVDVSDLSVEINTETLIPATVDVNISAYDDNNPSSIQYYVVELDADPGLEAYMISTDSTGDLTVPNPTAWISSSTALSDRSKGFESTSYAEHHGTLYIRGTNGGDVTVTVRKSDNTFVAGKVVSVASVTATPIPEFPTIAFPVAALIGIVFIFGRKKDGL